MEILFSHQFCDCLTFEQTLSEYYYVPGSGEGTQKWTPLNRGRGSKLVENLWRSFMDDYQHIFYW